MTQEQTDLLFKDLCGRLPYGVKVQTGDTPVKTINGLALPDYNVDIKSFCCKSIDWLGVTPYLFPLSSMTEEQKYDFYCRFIKNEINYNDFKEFYFKNNEWRKLLTSIFDCDSVVDWFNKYHFDYHNLIPMGLAIDCTYLNIY